ncbi:hypothetical protein H9Y04_40715 [Streptomyces sp. TRM66268-LWL]|uniref:Uncharacterized protein n=1 Tax=Streptomyces polyasparticus TaxID=2767826 RepID=A0ABR7SW49_9ACTN|nr:hypothetical protein [Streptomyces polyasparticus]MBC9718870.1 hypothetical protein [Streptomyces polyasparticus]
MTTEHTVRLSGPDQAIPETAAIRVIALLPPQWKASDLNCSGSTAAFTLTTPTALRPTVIDTAIDEILAHPGLHGWTRARPQSTDSSPQRR